jgi:hypothetical protein
MHAGDETDDVPIIHVSFGPVFKCRSIDGENPPTKRRNHAMPHHHDGTHSGPTRRA